MTRAGKNHRIGLAGGVLSLAGLCVGILSIGKKTEGRKGAAPLGSIPSLPDPNEQPREHRGEQGEIWGPEPVALAATESHGRQPAPPDNSDTKSTDPVASSMGPRSSRERIADLAGKGKSVLAIAQMLGISVGEVELTLKLQGRSAYAGRRL